VPKCMQACVLFFCGVQLGCSPIFWGGVQGFTGENVPGGAWLLNGDMEKGTVHSACA